MLWLMVIMVIVLECIHNHISLKSLTYSIKVHKDHFSRISTKARAQESTLGEVDNIPMMPPLLPMVPMMVLFVKMIMIISRAKAAQEKTYK